MPTLVLLHASATLVLAGVGWVVQLVVYPAFLLVPPPAWERYHAAHSRRITVVVGPPWIVQGVTTAGLLLADPLDPLRLACAATALGGVLATLGAVREHGRLRAPDTVAVRRLLRWNLSRTVLWTAGGLAALGLS